MFILVAFLTRIQDDEGESITIDSQASLDTAINKHLKEASKTLKIRISVKVSCSPVVLVSYPINLTDTL